jgi:type I restriction enzyme, S subunit
VIVAKWAEYNLDELLLNDFDGAWGEEAENSNGVTVLRSTDMRGGKLSFHNAARREIHPQVIKKKRLIDGDILVNKSSGSAHLVGASVIFFAPDDNDYLCSNFTRCLRPDQTLVDSEFLYFGLQSPQFHSQIFDAQRTTSGLRNLKISEFKAGTIPMPESLAEQRRIVARIKECMAQVEEIESLTEEQSKAESQVVRSARREFLGGPLSVPSGWEEKKLEELADVIYGISAAISKNKDPKIGPPIVRMANISIDGHLDLSDLRYCPIPKGKERHFALNPGDLLLNWRSGSAKHVGKTALFNETGLYTCASFILRIRSKKGISNNRFLRHVLNFMRSEGVFSGQSRMQINHKLNATEFSAFLVRIPSTQKEQERIADQLDVIESLSKDIGNEISKRDKEIQTIRESILRKAFAGEL